MTFKKQGRENIMSDEQPPIGASKLWHVIKKFWLLTLTGMAALILVVSYALMPVSVSLPKVFAASGSDLEKQMQGRAQLPPGYQISLLAKGFDRPRLMIETPKGDLIVSSRGSKIFILPRNSQNKSGYADKAQVLMSGLNEPHGILLHGDWLYVAEQHRVFRIRFHSTKNPATNKYFSGQKKIILDHIPNDGGHSTRTLKKGPDGWFYLSIGSSCNVCRERHPWRAALIRFHPEPKTKPEIFATGLRNTVGFDWQPGSDKLYGVDNGRDWLGDNFPPDELNHIEQGQFYGWPYRHGNNVPDDKYGRRFNGKARVPAFAFDAHIAPLSIRFLKHQKSPDMQNVALIAQHGSWNRSKKHGYRIVSLHFDKEGPIRRKIFLKGFLKKGDVLGRPVDILERRDGSLLISDDFSDVIWLVQYRG